MTLDGVIPVAHIHTAFRTVSQVNGNEAEVGRENNVGQVFFLIAIFIFLPFKKFHAVGWLVANLHHHTLQFLGPIWKIDEFLTADPGIGL